MEDKAKFAGAAVIVVIILLAIYFLLSGVNREPSHIASTSISTTTLPTTTVNNSIVVLVSPPTNIVPQGQVSTMHGIVMGGMPPYTYQWYEYAQGSLIAIANATSLNYTFSASNSTATGRHILELRATDSSGKNATGGIILNVTP
ncbi:MAG: hypothetical protein KGH64_03350 [Candidatus Micrarchaeota archaeon]|nr:hypothetical protein [Candidatus Micrarchaeota archaeon]MDE1834349.1 hypothetical protein [Candidatus Micrarchaeota archaeon]MDE1860035.1 hypothetical protein [Candidatus Micrarchaeota archaeon]